MRYRFLVNPAAGIRFFKHTLDLIESELRSAGIDAEVCVLAKQGEARRLAYESAQQGIDAVVVVGGDGTLNEAVGGLLGFNTPSGPMGLVGQRTCLGLIPHGTGNGFARGMQIPLDPLQAFKLLMKPKIRKIDVGCVIHQQGASCFINLCGVGYDAWIARKANDLRSLGKVHGLLRYVAAGGLSLLKFKPFALSMNADGRTLEGPTQLAVVANSPQYGFNAIIAPQAKTDDNAFDLAWIPPMPLSRMALQLPRLFKGQPIATGVYSTVQTVVMRAMDGQEVPFHVDGEPAGLLPIEISLMPKALGVIVP
jgi:diacylglycerol kinase (ATP)